MKAIIFFSDTGSSLDRLCVTAGLLRITGRELVLMTAEKLAKAGIGEVLLCCASHLREVSEFADGCKCSSVLTVCEPEQAEELADGEPLLLLGADHQFPSGFGELKAPECVTLLTCPELIGSETEDDLLCRRILGEDKVCFAGGVLLPAGYAFGGCACLTDILRGIGEEAVQLSLPKVFRLTDVQTLCEYQKHLLSGPGPEGSLSLSERIWSADGRRFGGVTLVAPVFIGRNVTIAPGSVIGPYTVIGDNVLIERRAKIEGSFVGQGAVIGAHSEMKRSAVFGGASAGASVRLGEGSAVGENACVGDGAVICAGVSVFSECSAAEGAYLCEDVTVGAAVRTFIDDEGSCSFPLRSAPFSLIRFGEAVASALPGGSVVAVCRSSSPASDPFAGCLKTGLLSGGCRVLDLGEGTRPLLAFALSRCSLNCGCYVSGGQSETVSLMSRGGLPLTEDTERAIERAYSGVSLRTAPLSDRGRPSDMSGIRELYTDWLRRVVSGSEERLCASVRCPNRFIQQLGDEIFAANAESTGERLIFNISHDGTSCSAYSHSLGYVMHERLAMLVMKNSFECGSAVSVPLEFPSAADSLAEEEGGRLLRYLNCSDGITDKAARECAASQDNLFIRDGLALAAFVTMTAAKRGRRFENVISEIPRFYCSQRFVSASAGFELSHGKTGAPAGNGAELRRDGGRAVIRPVKGSRGFMVFSDAASSETAASLCDELAARVGELYNKSDR